MIDKVKLEKNIPKVFWIKFFSGFMLLMPVIVPFFQSTNIGMKGVYLLQSVFAVSVFILEVPSGYVSDILGRKKTIMIAMCFKAIGWSLFPFSHGIEMLVVAEIILAFAVSLVSGTDTALLYDSLEALGSKKAQIKILGKSLSYFSFGEAIAALLTTLLLYLGLTVRDLAWISGAVAWIPFFIVMSMIEPPRKTMGSQHKENFKYILEGIFKQSRLLNLILLNTVLSFVGTLCAVWLFQKYWEDLHIPITYFGLLWALTNFTVAFVSRKAHKIEKIWGSKNTLLFLGLLPIAGYFGISFVDHTLGFLVCLIFQTCRAIGQVVFKDALNKRVSADFRATANSITAMGVRIIFTFLGPLIGWSIDTRGMSSTTFYMGLFYIAVFIFALLPLLKERKNFIPVK